MEALHGFLLINKPVGPSSAAVVGRLKWLLTQAGIPKKGPGRLVIGHGGTLDPLASGLLPIGLGKGTKQLQGLLEGPKTYQFTLQFGTQTSTGDAEGQAIATSANRPTLSQIEAVLPQFTGQISQTPPAYSALKVGGQRAYSLARKGEDVALQPRPITIYSIQVIDFNGENCTLEANVSKGTYIRTLAEDIAKTAQTVGHTTHLHRTQHGPFTLNQALPFEKLDKLLQTSDITPHILPLLPVPAAG